MIIQITKFIAQISFRERITTKSLVHTDFLIALFLELLALSNLIIVAQRNNISQLNSGILFLFHLIRLDFLQLILPISEILILSSITLFYFLCFRNRSSYFGLFIKILPIGCALLLIQIQIFINHNIKNSPIPLYQFLLIVISFIWIIKLIAFPQNYMTKHCKLTKFPYLLRISIFIIQILAFILKINIELFLTFTLIYEIISLICSLYTFQYICKDFEYLNFLSKYLKIMVCLIYLLQVKSLLPKNILIQYTPYAIFIILLVTDFFKMIFQEKYRQILEKHNLTACETIILYNLLLNQTNSNIIETSAPIFNFTIKNFAWNIMMKQFFHKSKDGKDFGQSEQILLINRLSDSKEYIEIWLEKQETRLKSEFLTIYLCFFYLLQQKYLKSTQYLMKVHKMRNYDAKSSLYQLIRLELENYKSKCESLHFIVEQQNFTIKSCLINRQSKVFSALNHSDFIQIQLRFEELIHKMQKLLNIMSKFLSTINNFSLNIQSERIKEILLQMIEQKHQIQALILQMYSYGHYNKKFLVIYYIYLNICCSQTYRVFEKLQPLLQTNTGNNDQHLKNKSSDNDMIVMVSLQDQYIGMIEYANIAMKNFFSIRQDDIKAKKENIQRIIPKYIASRHNELMMKFKQIGHSNFIGQKNKLVVIQNQEKPYEAYIETKIYVLLDGNISLTSRIIVVEEQVERILFNSVGIIFENTVKLNPIYKREESIINLFKLIDMKIKPKIEMIEPCTFTTDFQNKLSKITIESLKIRDTYIRICKIKLLDSSMKNIQQTLNQSTQNIIKKSSSEKQNCDYPTQNIDFQLRIQNLKLRYHPELFCFTFIFIIFLIISFSIVGYSFNYISYQFKYSGSIATFYASIVNKFRVRYFSMNNRYFLLHAIRNNIIPDDIASIYNISSLSKYIKDSTTSYLSDFDILGSLIINNSDTISISSMNKLTSGLINYTQLYQFQLSYISIYSIMKSFYHQTIFDSSDIFQRNWNDSILPFNIYLSNNVSYQINNNVYKAIMNDSIISEVINGNIIDGLIYLIGIVLLLLMAFILVIVYRIKNQTDECIELLTEIDVLSCKRREGKIKLAKKCINELTQTMIANQEIKYEDKLIKYYLTKENALIMQHGEIQVQKSKQNNIHIDKTYQLKKEAFKFNNTKTNNNSTKKKFTRSGFFKTHFHYILTILLFSILLFGILLWCLTISTSNYNALTFFYDYVNSISSFRLSQGIMLNVATAQLILPSLQQFDNMDINTMIQTLNSNIFHRTYEDIIKNSLQWDLVSDQLYKSYCDPTDQICKTLISGTLNENIPSAIMQFNNLNYMLYSNNNNMTVSSRNALLCQLWITYENYLKPIFLQIQNQNFAITNSKLSSAQNQLTLIFCNMIIPFMITFLLLGYYIVFKIFKQQNTIKYEILISDKMDYLISKLSFWNQINKLK